MKIITKEKAIGYTENYVKNGFNKTKAYMDTMKVDYKQANAHCSDMFNRVVNSGKVPKEYFDEEYIKREFKKTLKQAQKAKDLTNRLRTLEGMARIKAMFKDKTEITNLNPDTILFVNNNKPAIDNKDIPPTIKDDKSNISS